MKKWMVGLWLCLGIPGSLLAADWPGFLGPARTGVAEERLPATLQPQVRWRAQVGVGFSSIAVSGDGVFTMGYADGEETVWCLSTGTGEPIWKHRYPGKLLPNLHEGGPASTPMIDGDRVYTLGKEGQLYCLDKANGQVVWEQDVRKTFGVKVPEWGFSATALIEGNRLVLDLGPTVCLDKRTGKKIWATKKYKAGYGSAMRFEQGGKAYDAVLNNEGLIVIDPAEGQVLAFYKWPTSYDTNATTPLYHDGHLFVSTAYNKGCVLLKFDGAALTAVYEHQDMRNHMNNSILHEGHLYGFDRKAHNRRLVKLRCMEWGTGKITWSQENLGCGSLIRAGSQLIVLSDQGELVIAEANPTAFKERAREKVLDGKCWTPPALANGVVYARDAKGNLVAVGLE